VGVVPEQASSPRSFLFLPIIDSHPLCLPGMVAYPTTAIVLSRSTIEEKDWWTSSTGTAAGTTNDIGISMSTSSSGDDEEQGQEEDDQQMSPQQSKDTSIDTTTVGPLFHNRGYEVWEQCRAAWIGDRNDMNETSHVGGTTTNTTTQQKKTSSPPSTPNKRRNHRPLSNYQRRQVMANLTRQREYALPRKLRLDQVIGIYQSIWNQEE
jgi:hypothetical protein